MASASEEQEQKNAELHAAIAREFELLTAEQVAERAGLAPESGEGIVKTWRANGQIFGVDYFGEVYPAFQLDPATGLPRPIVASVLGRLPTGLRTGRWQLAAWWTTPLDLLDWRRPVDLLGADEPGPLLTASDAENREWRQACADS